MDGSYIALPLIFGGTSMLLSIVVVLLRIPANRAQGCDVSTSSAILVTICFFQDSHLDRCAGISHCNFDFHFPDD